MQKNCVDSGTVTLMGYIFQLIPFHTQALVSIKDKIRAVEGPDMKETMQDQIRQWFIECRYVWETSRLILLYTHGQLNE